MILSCWKKILINKSVESTSFAVYRFHLLYLQVLKLELFSSALNCFYHKIMRIVLAGQSKISSKTSGNVSRTLMNLDHSTVPAVGELSDAAKSIDNISNSSTVNPVESLNGLDHEKTKTEDTSNTESSETIIKPVITRTHYPFTNTTSNTTGSPEKVRRRLSMKNALTKMSKRLATYCQRKDGSQFAGSTDGSVAYVSNSVNNVPSIHQRRLFNSGTADSAIQVISASPNSNPKSILKPALHVDEKNDTEAIDATESFGNEEKVTRDDLKSAIIDTGAVVELKSGSLKNQGTGSGVPDGPLVEGECNFVSSAPICYLPDLSFSFKSPQTSSTEPAKKSADSFKSRGYNSVSVIEGSAMSMSVFGKGVDGDLAEVAANDGSQIGTIQSRVLVHE